MKTSGGRSSSTDQVRTVRRLYGERELTVAEIGGVLGVGRTSIYRALHRDLANTAAAGTMGTASAAGGGSDAGAETGRARRSPSPTCTGSRGEPAGDRAGHAKGAAGGR